MTRPDTLTTAPSAKDYEREAYNIHPGCWAVDAVHPLSTLLGSCVAVWLYDPELRLGGMNHFLLPTRQSIQNEEDLVLAGDYAMEVLVNAMLSRGVRKERLVAKAFGGGNVVSSIRLAIGASNVAFAQEWLQREGVRLLASDFGGPWSRKVIGVPQTGEVFCRRSPAPLILDAVREEAEYEQILSRPPGGDIELF